MPPRTTQRPPSTRARQSARSGNARFARTSGQHTSAGRFGRSTTPTSPFGRSVPSVGRRQTSGRRPSAGRRSSGSSLFDRLPMGGSSKGSNSKPTDLVKGLAGMLGGGKAAKRGGSTAAKGAGGLAALAGLAGLAIKNRDKLPGRRSTGHSDTQSVPQADSHPMH
jgi:hypothetical protein